MKLKQLDRIEFRQRYDMLKDKYGYSQTLGAITPVFAVLGFLFIMFSIYFAADKFTTALAFANIITLVCKVYGVMFLILIMADIISLVNLKKSKKALFEEYFIFKNEVKVKK